MDAVCPSSEGVKYTIYVVIVKVRSLVCHCDDSDITGLYWLEFRFFFLLA